MRRRYEEMTTTEMSAEGAGMADAVAVVPIAAIEQHGPHLPLGTDAMLADAMVDAVIAHMPEDRPVTFLPTLRQHSRRRPTSRATSSRTPTSCPWARPQPVSSSS